MDIYMHLGVQVIWLLWIEVREVSLGALGVRDRLGTGEERFFLGGGQGKGKDP